MFFIVYFLYFFILNRYILIFQEQNQLFRFSKTYFLDFLSAPGGISEYTGAFLTQFFLFPPAGPLILTLTGFAAFALSYYILKIKGIKGLFYSLVPVLLLAGLHSHYLYKIASSTGFILSLGYFALYISPGSIKSRYLMLIIGWPVLFYISGSYAFLASILCLIHELLYNKGRSRFLTSALIIILACTAQYLFSNIIFFMSSDSNHIYLIPVFSKSSFKYILILLLIYFPLILVIKNLIPGELKIKGKVLIPEGSLKSLLAGIFLIIILSGILFRTAYNRKTEILLGMDHYIQCSEWQKVLDLSSMFPDTNRLVMYFTNLSLYNTGQMGDNLFKYPQAGSSGLRLDWKPNGSTAFFGCGLFYQLGSTNEAYRWAFEAMVAIGPNPRSMKIMAATCLINDELPLAGKYLRLLNQSLFYRKWAQQYGKMLSDTYLIDSDPVLAKNRTLLVHSDFFAANLNLYALLVNYPENKMAYDYLLASLLLDRNLKGFSRVITDISNYNYKKLPVSYEEALIFYSSFEKQNFIPEGFSLSQETIEKFRNYAETFSRYSDTPSLLEKELKLKYGSTYWYYLHKGNTDF